MNYTNTDLIATETRYTDLAGTNKIGSTTMTYDALGRLTNLQHFNGSMRTRPGDTVRRFRWGALATR